MIIRLVLAALTVLIALIAATPVIAQEHYTQGPVWSVDYYRIGDDQFDVYTNISARASCLRTLRRRSRA